MKTKTTNTIPIRFAPSAAVLHTQLPREELAIRLLSGAVAFMVLAYIVLVSMSIVNVMARTEAQEDALTRRTAVAELEQKYFALSAEITAEKGAAIGLMPVASTEFVHHPGALGVANPRTQGL